MFAKVNFLDFVCDDCLIYFGYNSIFLPLKSFPTVEVL